MGSALSAPSFSLPSGEYGPHPGPQLFRSELSRAICGIYRHSVHSTSYVDTSIQLGGACCSERLSYEAAFGFSAGAPSGVCPQNPLAPFFTCSPLYAR